MSPMKRVTTKTTREVFFGSAYAPGACSIVNAYGCGLGAAFAIKLGVSVSVTLTMKPGGETKTRVVTDHFSSKGIRLVQECVRRTYQSTGFSHPFDARVKIDSTLPVARGLKSSSALSNATVAATMSAFGVQLNLTCVLAIALDAEFAAGTTRFGSVDDSWTSLLGGANFTDSASRRLLSRYQMDEDFDVVILIPPESSRQVSVEARESLKLFRGEISALHHAALEGDVFPVMTLNGLIHARQFGYDTAPIEEALKHGAKAGTLSGKGPAFVAIAAKPKTEEVVNAWKKYGYEILITRVQNDGLKIFPNKEVNHDRKIKLPAELPSRERVQSAF
jgi:shikimate kinase